ncbi:histone acetyltransferase type B catalytic subunit-like [Sinocyclocheilus grahami]|uniref:histone acetyltransferase type B catalytic subunit-like n=1 Tax=Sinocyclocheilus grahami TaxID=75366 RepID=UPI0007AC74B8|nr:PREDICTED: histone acetyltransferase type B catalytic subunit-like [Sinocyclocheilus grahami]
MAAVNDMEKKLAEYKCDTNEAVCLKLVRFPEDLDDESTTFHPEYSHQLFGDDEVAFGYKGLQIQLYYSAGNLSSLFKVKYTARVTDTFDCVEPDDVEGKIREIIPAGFCCNTDDFIVDTSCPGFREYHERLQTFLMWFIETASFIDVDDDRWDFFLVTFPCEHRMDLICSSSFQVDTSCPGFREYHERLQTFLMWFIETASFIDVDDDRWDFFLVFEKYNKDGETLYATVGYMTVYNYYVYPDKTRPRVSQMLILPPFQGEGHGAQLLETVHRYYCTSAKVQDITAEDPSENYVKLRDFVLVKLCLTLPSFSSEKLSQGFSEEMVSEAREKLKINKKHARRVYEILRLRNTDMSDEEKAKEFRLEVKKRLYGPYRKNQRELTKMQKCLRPEELASQISQMDTRLQHEELEKSYQDVLAEYRRVLERLAQA